MDTLSPEKRYCKVRKRKTKKCLDNIKNRSKANKENLQIVKKAKSNKPKSSSRVTNNGVLENKYLNNITKKRITIKHGLFAKGARSQTIKRIGLTEEFKARSEENLNKIIDLANGQPKQSSKTVKMEEVALDNCLNNSLKFEVDIKDKNLAKSSNLFTQDLFMENQINDSSSSSANSPVQKLDLRNSSVGHISPIKFSPKNKLNSQKSQFTIIERKNIPTVSKPALKVIADYKKKYEEFTKDIPHELKKFLPSKTNNSTSTLLKKLKAVYEKRCHKMNNEKVGKQQKMHPKILSKAIKRATENSVILNPIQFLKKANASKYVLESENNDFPSNCAENDSKRKCYHKHGASNSKYLEALNNFEISDVSDECQSRKLSDTQHYKNLLKTPQENKLCITVSDNSSEELSQYSVYEIQDEIVLEKTPEPIYFPRRMNFEK